LNNAISQENDNLFVCRKERVNEWQRKVQELGCFDANSQEDPFYLLLELERKFSDGAGFEKNIFEIKFLHQQLRQSFQRILEDLKNARIQSEAIDQARCAALIAKERYSIRIESQSALFKQQQSQIARILKRTLRKLKETQSALDQANSEIDYLRLKDSESFISSPCSYEMTLQDALKELQVMKMALAERDAEISKLHSVG
jgi:hypothetical protein